VTGEKGDTSGGSSHRQTIGRDILPDGSGRRRSKKFGAEKQVAKVQLKKKSDGGRGDCHNLTSRVQDKGCWMFPYSLEHYFLFKKSIDLTATFYGIKEAFIPLGLWGKSGKVTGFRKINDASRVNGKINFE